MPYVDRGGDGKIHTLWANSQRDGHEFLATDHAEVVAFINPPPTVEELRDATFRSEADRIDLMTRLQTATPAQISAWIDTNVTNIATARTVLKAILKVIALWARGSERP